MTEKATYIGGLIRTSPTPQDFKKLGDDEIRLLKAVLLNTIAGFPGAALVQGADVGTANTYVLNPQQQLMSYTVGTIVLMTPANLNGGDSTLNISSLGARGIRRIDGTVLANGDLVPGVPVLMAYDGTTFRLLSITKAYIDQLILTGTLPGQENNDGLPLITDGTNATFRSNFGRAMDEAKGANIAATPTLNLNSAAGTGNWTHITGTGVTINAITLPAGAERDLIIDSAGNTLAHGVNLDLPGKANIVTQAGDRLTVRGDGSGKAFVVDYVRASGRAVVEQTPPGWVLLTPTPIVPAAGVTAIDFLTGFASTYDDYVVQLDGIMLIPEGAPSSLMAITLRVARGGVVDAGNNYRSTAPNTSTSAGAGVLFYVAEDIPGSTATVSASFTLSNTNSASAHGVELQSFASAPGGTAYAHARLGMHFNNDVSTPLSGFRLAAVSSPTSGGGLTHKFAAAGTIKIYGIRKV